MIDTTKAWHRLNRADTRAQEAEKAAQAMADYAQACNAYLSACEALYAAIAGQSQADVIQHALEVERSTLVARADAHTRAINAARDVAL